MGVTFSDRPHIYQNTIISGLTDVLCDLPTMISFFSFLTTKAPSNQCQKRPYLFVLIEADCRFFAVPKEGRHLMTTDPLRPLELRAGHLKNT